MEDLLVHWCLLTPAFSMTGNQFEKLLFYTNADAVMSFELCTQVILCD